MRACAPIAAGLASASWEALGTSVDLRLTDPAALALARDGVESELDAIDRACSRFRTDSELTRLNASAGRAVVVSPLLIEALEVALRAASITNGDVDPTVGLALELAGYDRDWRLLEAPQRLRPASLRAPERGLEERERAIEQPERAALTARLLPGWRAVRIDRARRSVRIPRGVRLDLGATAKAWAADRAAKAAAEATGCGVLVSLGGDIATCGPAPPAGWEIRVTDDHRSDPSAPGQTVSIRSGGLATSSTAVRRWSHRGQDMHHIIDPRTEAPVKTTWRTVSVAAADCTQANIAATTALVRSHSAPAWLEQLGLPARLLGWDGSVTALAGWPAESVEPLEPREDAYSR
jgi:thiamine biosynthesis lipoprotein ApbE